MQIYPTAGVLFFNGGILSVGAGSNLQVHPVPASRSGLCIAPRRSPGSHKFIQVFEILDRNGTNLPVNEAS